MLQGVLLLHGVDAERMCGQVVTRFQRRSQAALPAAEVEDLMAFLLATIWELSERFEPAKDRRGVDGFASYAGRILDRRVTDWHRSRFLDGRYATEDERRNFVNALSLDSPAEAGGDPLGATLPDGRSDFENGRAPACGGLLMAGDQSRDRDLDLLAAAAARRAADELEQLTGSDDSQA